MSLEARLLALAEAIGDDISNIKGGPSEFQVATLGADVALSANNTWYNGPSVTLGPGTWLILAHGHFHRAATTAGSVNMRIRNVTGNANLAAAGAYYPSFNGANHQLAANDVLTVTAATVVTLQMSTTAGAAAAAMKASTVNNASNGATRLIAVRLSGAGRVFFKEMTQAAYDAEPVKDPDILYLVEVP